jgi:hypothetical protein
VTNPDELQAEKEEGQKGKDKASKKADKEAAKASTLPFWAKVTRHEIYRD